MSVIKFGTDGWRAILAQDFTFANVRVVAQGIAHHIVSNQMVKKGVVIGYDNRFLSERFADVCARVMMGNGIKVYFPPRGIPTPVAAYLVRHFQAAGALMITASHNPPEYNGIKFIPHYAGPAMPDVTDDIEEEIARTLESGRVYELDRQEGANLGLWEEVDGYSVYREGVLPLINRDAGGQRRKIVVDPMYGVGSGYLDALLGEMGHEVVVLHGKRDPLFGGGLPEPTGHHLRELAETVVAEGAALGLATDGDADRFGIINEKGEFVSPNEFLSLALEHLLRSRSSRGPVARTVATTHRLDQIAAKNGLKVIETPVGFKYIGQCLREQGAILGGEESGGMSIFGHIPEKDGILAGLLAAEMVASTARGLGVLQEEMEAAYGKLVSERLDLHYEENQRQGVAERLSEYWPRAVAGQHVESVITTDGKKIILADGSWLLIRPSGTEPLFRLYVESREPEMKKAIQDDVRQALGI